MLTNHFYHEIIRKTIVSFGTLFNNIEIQHKDSSDKTVSVLRVPISYGPTQKFLARLEQSRDLRSPGRPAGALTLPRMSFELIGCSYDASRKVSTMQTFKAVNKESSKLVKGYMPVPYNFNIQLSILAKLNEDALQILEQILPYFQPSFNLTIDLVSVIGEKRDMPITLDSISMDDNYEGDFTTRRSLTYTLNFTCKSYLFGPINASSDGLIKKVQADFYSDTANTRTATRQVRYTAVPVAVTDYNNDNTAQTSEIVTDKVTAFNISSAVPFNVDDYIEIDKEVMKIKSKDGNRITVIRGEFGTSIATHDIATQINVVNYVDNDLIEEGDDFGFGETRYDYDSDGYVYSVSQSVDRDL
jgi:hypothetical protein